MYFIMYTLKLFFFFCIQISHWPSTTYWKDILPPLNYLAFPFLSTIICPFMYENFYFAPSTYGSIILHQFHTVLISVSVSLKIKYCYSSNFILPFQSFFDYSRAFALPYEYQNQLVNFTKCLLGFWLEYHWIYKSFPEEMLSQNIENLVLWTKYNITVYLCLLNFLLATIYNFQCLSVVFCKFIPTYFIIFIFFYFK